MFRILSMIKSAIVFLICLGLLQFSDSYALSIRPPVLNSISNPERDRQEAKYEIMIMTTEIKVVRLLESLQETIEDTQGYFFIIFKFDRLVDVNSWLKKVEDLFNNEDVNMEITADGKRFSNLEGLLKSINEKNFNPFTTVVDIIRSRDMGSAI